MIKLVYEILFKRYGPQYWWPAETLDEILIGAILTQNTAWKNVEKAIQNLKENNVLTLSNISNLPTSDLENIIKPAGFYKVKSRYLKSFAVNMKGKNIKDMNLAKARKFLLKIVGIGPETADTILLYGYQKPVFVIDAYTRRICSRIGICNTDISYSKLQSLFLKSLPLKTSLFNEYHALLVKHAKVCCRSKPLCENCNLKSYCKMI